jgi:hypothetical protein
MIEFNAEGKVFLHLYWGQILEWNIASCIVKMWLKMEINIYKNSNSIMQIKCSISFQVSLVFPDLLENICKNKKFV